MHPVVLRHCIPVTIWGPQGPTDVDVTITVGGAPGDGSVSVMASGSGSGSVPTGSTQTLHFDGATQVTLHYMKSPTGPAQVSGEWEVTPS